MSDLSEQQQRIQTACLLFLASFAMAIALYLLRSAMIPFALSLALAIALAPLMHLLTQGCKLPRVVAIGMTFLLGLILLVALSGLIAVSVSQLAENGPEYEAHFAEMVTRISNALPLEKWGIDPAILSKPLDALPKGAVSGLLVGTMQSLTSVFSQTFVVLIFLLFLLMGGSSLPKGKGTGLVAEATRSVQRYLTVKLATSSTTALLTFLILWFCNVPLALVFAIFAFLLNFIPNVGSIIAVLLPIPVLFLSPDTSLTTAILALALPSGVQFMIGNLIEPRLMGKHLGLHPIVILLALIFWGVAWGIIGMLLAAPITATLRIILERIPQTRPVAMVMAGKWPTSDTDEPSS
jgi:AI-2 transport protein TqsA